MTPTPEDVLSAFVALRSIRELGIKIEFGPNGGIRWHAPDGLPESVREKLIQHRDGILRILRGEAIAGAPVLRVEVRGKRPDNKRAVLVFFDDPNAPKWV